MASECAQSRGGHSSRLTRGSDVFSLLETHLQRTFRCTCGNAPRQHVVWYGHSVHRQPLDFSSCRGARASPPPKSGQFSAGSNNVGQGVSDSCFDAGSEHPKALRRQARRLAKELREGLAEHPGDRTPAEEAALEELRQQLQELQSQATAASQASGHEPGCPTKTPAAPRHSSYHGLGLP